MLADPEIALDVEAILYSIGITDIEYYFVIRSPGDYFISLLDQMSRHGVYLDDFQCFDEIMRTGNLRVPMDRNCTNAPPGGWSFVFDRNAALQRFMGVTRGRVNVVGFDSSGPFPGCEIIESLVSANGCSVAVDQFDTSGLKSARNASKDKSPRARNYAATLSKRCSARSRLSERAYDLSLGRTADDEFRNFFRDELNSAFGSMSGLPLRPINA